jgi:hypothetical protein
LMGCLLILSRLATRHQTQKYQTRRMSPPINSIVGPNIVDHRRKLPGKTDDGLQ